MGTILYIYNVCNEVDANASAWVAVRVGEAQRGERSSGLEGFADCREAKGDRKV